MNIPSSQAALSPRAVFFDVDDTLYDHLIPFRQALQNVLHTNDQFPYAAAYHRMRYYSDYLSAQAGGTPTHGNVLLEMRRNRFKFSLEEFGLHLTDSQADMVQEEYLQHQFTIQLFDGAKELIEQLKDRDVTVGLITNGPPQHQMQKITALGIRDMIPADLIFISGAVGITKPDRGLFDHVAGKLGLPTDACCYIGDSWRNDVIGALNGGWNVIWFNHRGVNPESEHRPHYEAASYDELAALLL
ncbi:HAD family hydrolase [Paenibacillus sp. D2_2]|uniref:HAD family hydrolase n=1 Tax=Paenibacillus sp. D2_2 TaxID=3073092 RepID=UPI002815FB2A|nr:HAD family hydrolase [Paenibacillus sp. D2_2]WMT42081.1 HAD family hydrolase [Paenibacillus sp. D2_2]